MSIGIDKIGFYVPKYYIDMRKLAKVRGVDPDKFTYGLGQDEMAVPPITQDMISLAANAVYKTISEDDKKDIDLVILASESGTDYSKAGSTSIVKLLGLNPQSRAIEIKQACYSATAALQLAKGHIALNPNKKALVIASDISRYGLNTPGEPTQGAGAVVMLISNEAKLLEITNQSSYFSDDIWDFWRPNYSDIAFVDGKYSNEQYQRLFKLTYQDFIEKFDYDASDFDAFLFHIPYTKLGRKTLNLISDEENHLKQFENAIYLNRKVGNVYTASLYLSLISLLYKGDLKDNSTIGLYSYGSGAVGEFFTMKLKDNYKEHLNPKVLEQLEKRIELDIPTYEKLFNAKLVQDGSHQILDNDQEKFQLKEIKNHRRYYIEN